jgi:hypothetical protein
MSETAVQTIRVVKVGGVQNSKPGTGYVNVPDPLYVAKGTTVTFKAIPSPSNPVWPPDTPQWSGSSGASGTGCTKDVAFNTVSYSSTDYKTVTVACGNSVTVNVIVYDIQIISADASSPDSTKINCRVVPSGAVAESVDFSAPGKTDSKSNVSGDFYFTYDQDDISSYGQHTTSIEDTWGLEVDCSVTKNWKMPADAPETLSAYF